MIKAGAGRLSDPFRILSITFAIVVAVLACGTVFAANNPVPYIDQPTVPSVAVPGGSGFTLTVNGAGFVNGSVVNWNGGPLVTTFVSAGQVTAEVSAPDIATASTASVTVTNPAPGGGTSNVAYFEVTTPASSVTVAGLQLPALAGVYPPIAADLNNDGKLDLIVISNTSNQAAAALGNGDGTFEAQIPIVGGSVESPTNLVLADFNGDGKIDIAVVPESSFPSNVSILLGNGNGTFQAPIANGSQDNTGYEGLAVGDFNQDGKLDIITHYTDGSNAGLAVLIGNGDGTFQAPVDEPTPYSGQLIVADLNGDGLLDLVIQEGGENPGAVTVAILGNGDGTFQPPVVSGNANFLQSAAVADVNGDGKLDLISWNFEDDPSFFFAGAGVSLGDGSGAFTSAGAGVSGFPAFPPGDFNGDGKLDFVLAAALRVPPPDDLSLATGNGDGTFAAGVALTTTTDLSLGPLIQGDFNGDGKTDLIAEDQNGVLWMFLQGSFAVGSLSPASLTFGSQTVGTTSSSQAATLRNTGTETLTLSAVSVSGTNGSEFKQTNTCPSSLAIGATCQITVTFAPSASGAQSAILNIPNNGIGSKAVSLTGTGADFVATAPTPSSATVAPGQTANYTFEIVPLGGFSQTVALTCGGAPAGSICTLPASVVLSGSTNATVAVSVTTTASSVAMKRSAFSDGQRWLASAFFGLPLIISLAGVHVRRRWRHAYRCFFLLLTLAAILLMPACGGGSSSGANGAGSAGTPAGTYSLTVAGTYTSGGAALLHTVTLTLVVQ